MRVLITGSSGFVGSHIVQRLVRGGHDVVGVDREVPTGQVNQFEFVQCDVGDDGRLSEVVSSINPDAIVHGSAITPGDEEVTRAMAVYRVNAVSTLSLLMAAADTDCRRFVLLSSAGVYADPPRGVELDEDSPVANTGGLYAQTKLASERLCTWASRELDLSTTVLRIGPVYGSHERPTATRQRMSPIYRAIHLARDAGIVRCNAPDTVYNWIHGDDVGRALQTVLETPGRSSTYNLAGPPVSMRMTLDAVQAAIPDTDIVWSTSTDEVNLSLPDVSRPISSDRIHIELGFEPQISLDEGIQEILVNGE